MLIVIRTSGQFSIYPTDTLTKLVKRDSDVVFVLILIKKHTLNVE